MQRATNTIAHDKIRELEEKLLKSKDEMIELQKKLVDVINSFFLFLSLFMSSKMFDKEQYEFSFQASTTRHFAQQATQREKRRIVH
jgi:hypothetical protein